MNLALKQARMILGNTKKNPAVGCVIVKKNYVVGAGHTSKNGRPHAEFNAVKSCINRDVKKANMFVTLEPCSNYGITPPCVKLIIKKDISKVYFSVNDPDLRSYNKSTDKFRKKFIYVNKGLLKKDIELFYRSYFKYKKNKLPFVTCKLAVSKDFFTINKKKAWITNKYSRGRVHLMRSNHDCILTSVNTVNIDNPILNCRIEGLLHTSPTRVILDKNLKIRKNSKILKTSKKIKTIIFYNKMNNNKLKILKKLNIKLIWMPVNYEKNLKLKEILKKLKNLGFSRIFLESGLNLTKSFLNENLVDDFKLFISSNKLGNEGDGNIKKYLNLLLKNKKKVTEKVNLLGEKLISYKIS